MNYRMLFISIFFLTLTGCALFDKPEDNLPKLVMKNVTSPVTEISPGEKFVLNIAFDIIGKLYQSYEVLIYTRFYDENNNQIAHKTEEITIEASNSKKRGKKKSGAPISKNITQSFTIPKSAMIGNYYYEVEVQLLADSEKTRNTFQLIK